MDKNKFLRYGFLKGEEKKIKTEIVELGLSIKEEMMTNGADKVPAKGIGTFTIKSMPVWSYSKAVEDAENKVDKLKAEEKATGIATMTNRQDLVFKAEGKENE